MIELRELLKQKPMIFLRLKAFCFSKSYLKITLTIYSYDTKKIKNMITPRALEIRSNCPLITPINED